MALYKNLTAEISRIGHIAKVSPNDPKSFIYAKSSDTNILGVITQSVAKYEQCEIQNTGIASVYVSDRAVSGAIIRLQKAGDNISRATCKTAQPTDAPYYKIGTALESGKGLVLCSLSLIYMAGGSTQSDIVIVTTTPYTVGDTVKSVIVDSAVAVVVNLPPATGSGRELLIASINVGEVTVTSNGADDINGDATQILTQWDGMDIEDYANQNWVIK